MAEAVAAAFYARGAVAVGLASEFGFIFGGFCANRVLSAHLAGGAFAACAARFDTSILAANLTGLAACVRATARFAGFGGGIAVFAGSTSSVRGATFFAGLGGGIAVFAGSASSVGGAACFTSSSIAVLSGSASSVRGTRSGFALCIFADLARPAVFVATAARFAGTGFADLAGAAVGIAGTLGGGTFSVGAGLTARTIVGAFATIDALARNTDLSEFAFFVACTGGEALFAHAAGTDLSVGTIGITAATFGARSSGGFADRSEFAVCVGFASVGFAAALDTELAIAAIVVGVASLAALILATDLAARTLGISATTFGASAREADLACGAIFVRRALGFGRIGRSGFGSAVRIADTVAAIAGTIQAAILGSGAVGSTGAFDTRFVGSAVGVASAFCGSVGIDGATARQTDLAHRAMCITETIILGLRGIGLSTATVGIPRIDIAVASAVITTKAAREQDGGCKEKTHQ